MVKFKTIIFLFFIILLYAFGIFAQDTPESTTLDRIFNPRFRTLKTQAADLFLAPPVIRLGTADRIVVTFDELGEDNSYLEYRLIHCNADWRPSRLVESEYLDGFNSVRIEDYAFSTATYVHYTNYRIEIPSDELAITRSGNYLLQVYDPEDPDETLLQTRFQISENLVTANAVATSRTDRGHYGEWQQLAMQLNCEALPGVNPYQDLIVEVMQNQQERTRRVIKAPIRVIGQTAVYEHQPELLYKAGNEYRRFESVSNMFPGMNVDSLKYMGTNYHVWLKPEEERANREYQYDQTQNGRFIVREYNSTDSDIGADYITVHFSLDYPELPGADIYIDGEFSHNSFTSANRMTYNPDLRQYTAEIPLKQGQYNYQYVVKGREEKDQPSPEPIEGNKYETDNEYTVSVYFRPPGARADRLVGHTTLHSIRN